MYRRLFLTAFSNFSRPVVSLTVSFLINHQVEIRYIVFNRHDIVIVGHRKRCLQTVATFTLKLRFSFGPYLRPCHSATRPHIKWQSVFLSHKIFCNILLPSVAHKVISSELKLFYPVPPFSPLCNVTCIIVNPSKLSPNQTTLGPAAGPAGSKILRRHCLQSIRL